MRNLLQEPSVVDIPVRIFCIEKPHHPNHVNVKISTNFIKGSSMIFLGLGHAMGDRHDIHR